MSLRQINTIKIEKSICKKFPNNIISAVFCDIRYISRDNVKMNLWTNFSQPIYEAWIHAVVYYRFNGLIYQRFPVNLYEDLCGWLAKKSQSYILHWTFEQVLQYSNMNHHCPYNGHVYVKIDNISANNFLIEQFLPAGKFRLDINITNSHKGAALVMGSLFFSVSDNRVEKFW